MLETYDAGIGGQIGDSQIQDDNTNDSSRNY